MAKLSRQIDYRMKGSLGNDEYWTYLIFDTETNRLYVEEEWNLNDMKGHSTQGKRAYSIEEFLSQGGQGAAQRTLLDFIHGLFPKR